MSLKVQNVLFLTRSMHLGGTENVILQLCEILQPIVNKIVVCSCGGVNVKKLESMGIEHFEIPDIAVKKPSKILSTIRMIKSIVKIEKITIIHSHHRMAAFIAQFVFKKKIIHLATAHNTFQDKRILTRFSYGNTSIIAVGEQVKKNLVDYYRLQNEQITVIHNAVKAFDGNVKPIKCITKERKQGHTLIANVGRLTEQKGMEYFIRAAADVHKKNSMTRFFIVGDGEDREKLEILVKDNLPKGVIYFMGYRIDVQNVMRQVDFIVLSSLWEGFPLTPIEAFSVGKTVIATEVDGTVEIVTDKKNGYLIPPKDFNAIEEKILDLIKYPEKRRELEINCKKTFEEEFSFAQFSDSVILYYQGIING